MVFIDRIKGINTVYCVRYFRQLAVVLMLVSSKKIGSRIDKGIEKEQHR